MTPKELWLAALRLEPVDRLPFWPKLDAAYQVAHGPRFREATVSAIHDYVGSDRHQAVPSCLREIRTKTAFDVDSDGQTMRTVYRTAAAVATATRRSDQASQSWHPIEFPVKTVEDIHTLTEWYADVRYELDDDALEAAKAAQREIGSRAVTAHTIGESPLMHFIQWLAGVESAHLLLADHPAEVEGLFEVMHRALLQRARLLAEHCPADLLYLSENTSTTLISPEQYRRYCAPRITEYGRVLRDRGRLLVLHMCGHLKELLPQLALMPAAAFEAFTSPTLGNTTLLDGRAACPDKCLIGGTNAVLWTRPLKEVIDQIERDLDALPHHRGIVVTSAGVMPPGCRPETIKEVCEWVKSYPVRA